MSNETNDAALAVLREERRNLLTQLVRMAQEFTNTTMPLVSRLRAVEDKLGKIPEACKGRVVPVVPSFSLGITGTGS
jgi:hypothetical protein